MPATFLPCEAVYKTFARWAAAGVFEQQQVRLREQWRSRIGRAEAPTAAVIDAQSNRSSPQRGESGFDAGKKVIGRERNLVVDTMGLVIAPSVTAASVQGWDAVASVMAQACEKAPVLATLYTMAPTLESVPARSSSGTRSASKSYAVRKPHDGILAQHRKRPSRLQESTGGFVVLPKRWVVERTHAWTERWRRIIMHHDRKLAISAAWAWLAEARMLLSKPTFKS